MDGCANCYAMPIAERLCAQGVHGYENVFRLTMRPGSLEMPLHWAKPRLVFVDSMYDLFHQDVPLEYIQRVFAIMKRANWHIYTILTVRSERLREQAPYFGSSNIANIIVLAMCPNQYWTARSINSSLNSSVVFMSAFFPCLFAL